MHTLLGTKEDGKTEEGKDGWAVIDILGPVTHLFECI